MDTSWLTNRTISQVLTPLCEPVHAAWVDEHTTPLATSRAVLRLDDGELVMLAPCEVDLAGERYPALGLSVEECDTSTLQLVRNGNSYSMTPLVSAAELLPFLVCKIEESDPLGEGAIGEILLIDSNGSRLLFRHIMPPMTLGIDLAKPGQAPNNSFKPKPLRGSA